MKTVLTYKGAGKNGELIENLRFKEYISININVETGEGTFMMEMVLLSLDSIKEKYQEKKSLENSVCIGGNLFTVNPFSGTNIIVENLQQVSIEEVRTFISETLAKQTLKSVFDIRLTLFPIIRYVYMDDVDESHMTFYEQTMDTESRQTLSFQWAIEKLELSYYNSNTITPILKLEDIQSIDAEGCITITFQLIIDEKKIHKAFIKLVDPHYFFSYSKDYFQSTVSSFMNSCPYHVVSDYSYEKVNRLLNYIFDRVAGSTEKEILKKLSAFVELS